ncbi:MAG: type II toxin-antitoxin system RelB/DinJ family antitoxin [Erysipelotrichaceae bacterium]|jgi:DNA-damage-inducible protein J|nr:type II toxin-antitoxin system RelB/DinJ family antitoxin [Erysipelotrichaceae bacterium]
MSQATFSIRMDTDLKKQFDEICEDMGMSATTAFNIFARTVVREKRIPFEIHASDDKEETSITQEDLLKALASLKK